MPVGVPLRASPPRWRLSPPQILIDAILNDERRIDGFVCLPRPGDIRKITALARLTGHSRPCRQGVNGYCIEALAARTCALPKGGIDSRRNSSSRVLHTLSI